MSTFKKGDPVVEIETGDRGTIMYPCDKAAEEAYWVNWASPDGLPNHLWIKAKYIRLGEKEATKQQIREATKQQIREAIILLIENGHQVIKVRQND